jgi:hypothetical protein
MRQCLPSILCHMACNLHLIPTSSYCYCYCYCCCYCCRRRRHHHHRLYLLKAWLSFTTFDSSTARYCLSNGACIHTLCVSADIFMESPTIYTAMQTAHYECFDAFYFLLLAPYIVTFSHHRGSTILINKLLT